MSNNDHNWKALGWDQPLHEEAPPPRFLVVTPSFNSEQYIDDTILSVVSQSGSFELLYHVQDGGSRDGTLAILQRWERLLQSGEFPIGCRKLGLTYATAPDKGMYQAINRGAAAARPQGPFIMGWINSDDRLAPGALATLEAVYRSFPAVRFTCARTSLMDEQGSIMGVNLPVCYDQAALAQGDHDGRRRNFVMQEGCFWRSELWDEVGGLDETFKLAGDWDLWRRFAERTPLVTLDTLLGFHRRRPGQLTAEMDRYYAEVDAMQGRLPPPVTLGEPKTADVIRFDTDLQAWVFFHNYGRKLGPPIGQGQDGARVTSVRVNLLKGVREPEGPYPEWNLPLGMRWVDQPQVSAQVNVPIPGVWLLALDARSWRPRLHLRIRCGGSVCFEAPLGAGENGYDTHIRLPVRLDGGPNRLEFECYGDVGDAGAWLFIILDCYVQTSRGLLIAAPIPSALPNRLASAAAKWPRISVVVPSFNYGRYIGDTLSSLLAQSYPDLEIIVIDGGSDDRTLQVVQSFSEHLAYFVSEPDAGQSDAINKGMAHARGDILTWLNSDDALAAGALYAVAAAFMADSTVDMVAGVCVSVDDVAPVRRHLPTVSDGPLPLAQILDLDGSWLQGRFFHQPEVFFGRRIWEAAGGRVETNLYYSMDYNLWARFALLGAQIRVIGAEVARFRLHPEQKTASPQAYLPELRAHSAELARRMAVLPAAARRSLVNAKLKIVMFNDYGYKYGAGVAHRRLAAALGLASHVVVFLAYADLDLGKPDRDTPLEDILSAILDEAPDLVVVGNQHAIRADYVELLQELVRTRTPTVFFAHDEWLITGRCGYPGDCERLFRTCDAQCPTADLYPALPKGWVEPAFRAKRELLAEAAATQAPLAIFTNSNYMQQRIETTLGRSAAPPVRSVRLGVDTAIFRPRSRYEARRILDLPQDHFIVLTVAASLADTRKGLDRVTAAFDAVRSPAKLLVIMGFVDEAPPLKGEARLTGLVTDESLSALYYAAADVLVGASRSEAFGQAYIEAAATGTPSLACGVGGIVEAVIHDQTGLLVPPDAPAALSAGLQRMHDEPQTRRRLGAGGVLHARTRYSLEASAWSFLCALEALAVFRDVRLAPNIVLSTEDAQPPFLRYLAGLCPTPSPDDGWETGPGLLREKDAAPASGMDAGYAWLLHPRSRVFLRSAVTGHQAIVIRGRSIVAGQTVTLNVNGRLAGRLEYVEADEALVETRIVRAELIAGMNRLDFEFAEAGGFPHDPRPLTFVLDSLEVGEDVATAADTPDRAAPEWEPLSGFGQLEGPYPEHGVLTRFRWIDLQSARLRVYAARSGMQHLRVVCRNHTPGQSFQVILNGAPAGTVTLDGSAFIEVSEAVIPVVALRGWNLVTLKIAKASELSFSERGLYVAVHEVQLLQNGSGSLKIGVRRQVEGL